MNTPAGHLSYCSNIHPGEDWATHFAELQRHVPGIRAAVAAGMPFGIGLRLAHQASLALSEKANFEAFVNWLAETGCYVFTMNGFPYGSFHDTPVKDRVHAPDWTTPERTAYTLRLFELLARLLPDGVATGGVSTSPLSYRHWWPGPASRQHGVAMATENIVSVVERLILLEERTGKVLHLDLEPEPDGLLETSEEYISWYKNDLLPTGIRRLGAKGFNAEAALRRHVQLCYDVCHMAVGFEDPGTVINRLEAEGLYVGKIQISSALKVDFSAGAAAKIRALTAFAEPTYLHQVVARRQDGTLLRFRDLPEALAAFDGQRQDWRIHFHVPLFLENYGLLASTQADIIETLRLQLQKPFTGHLEIETYTWGVLPAEFQASLSDSIVREISWVKGLL